MTGGDDFEDLDKFRQKCADICVTFRLQAQSSPVLKTKIEVDPIFYLKAQNEG